MSSILALIQLARPHQHVKNVFVLLPLFFAGGLTNWEKLGPALAAFVAFSLTASAVYVLNDLLDLEEDRNHPQKRTRPLASGLVTPARARIWAILLGLSGLTLSLWLSLPTFVTLLGYALMNVAYSLKLKQVSLLDVTLIATGFVLRLFVGSLAAGIPLSNWIVVLTFFLALFLALAKRRDDLVIHARTGRQMRIASTGYNLEMLNSAITLLGASVILTYLQYTTSTAVTERLASEYLYLTTLFVVLGILRYLQITFVFEHSGSPTRVLLRDRFTQLNLIAWLLTFGWILYLS